MKGENSNNIDLGVENLLPLPLPLPRPLPLLLPTAYSKIDIVNDIKIEYKVENVNKSCNETMSDLCLSDVHVSVPIFIKSQFDNSSICDDLFVLETEPEPEPDPELPVVSELESKLKES